MKLFVHENTGEYRQASPKEIVEAAKANLGYLYKRGQLIQSVASSKEFFQLKIGDLEHEVFACLFLDNRHRVIVFEIMFQGTIDGASVYPREVVKRALYHNAAAVVFCHNHPSGITDPSRADEQITLRLKDSLALIDVVVLDHIIVSAEGTTSFAERGIL